jgi:hypothetical protein
MKVAQIHALAARQIINLDTTMTFFPAADAPGMELWTADGEYVMLFFDAEETARLAAYSATRTESAIRVQAQELSSVRSAHEEQIELLDRQRSLLGQPLVAEHTENPVMDMLRRQEHAEN